MLQHWVAGAALAWYGVITLIIAIGVVQLYRHFSEPAPAASSPHLPPDRTPHVTAIRPIVGTDPYLYECLASTFHQKWPASKLSIHFCIPTRDDPAYPILRRLLQDFPNHDARIYIAEQDPVLIRGQQGEGSAMSDSNDILGPNPKIRNMSRAYREARGNIIWIIDCNVWASPSVVGHMVDRLCGFGAATGGRKYKFTHQTPLAVDVSDLPVSTFSSTSDLPDEPSSSSSPAAPLMIHANELDEPSVLGMTLPTGNRLEEMFLSTSHAKFYTAIGAVAVAPCTVGKSNMFRKSHLDALTQPSHPGRSPGIDFFSENICEDHLISDLLWRSPVPQSVFDKARQEGRPPGGNGPCEASSMSWGNHALILNPPCIQPLAGLSLAAYTARRSRWLRVRKFTVPAATAVEPATESFVANAYLAFALTTLPYFREHWGVPPTWTAFVLLWIAGEAVWCVKDWWIWGLLQQWEDDGKTDVAFVGHALRRRAKEGVWHWFKAWLGREALAFPIWAWAIFGGVTVVWRGKSFWVGLDMKVHEIKEDEDRGQECGVGKQRRE